MNNTFIDEIRDLIDLKQEGGYWDYKEKYHDNNAKFLHDIICLANNLVNRDAYLIFGVSDSGEIKGVDNDEKRKKQSDIIDMLRNQSFTRGIAPRVKLETLILDNKTVDVLVIFNSNDIPFYLEKDYKIEKSTVLTGVIYTRRQDTNTPLNKVASSNEVEYLWKKRFGLDSLPYDKLCLYIKDKFNWESNSVGRYYKFFPEYLFLEVEDSEYQNRDIFYAYTQVNESHYFKNYQFRYHQTILHEGEIVIMDSGRYVTSTPKWEFLELSSNLRNSIPYKYYILDSLDWSIHEFLFELNDQEARIARDRFLSVVLIFETEYEKLEFNDYLYKVLSKEELNQLCYTQPKTENFKKVQIDHDIKVGKYLKNKLEEFRKQKH